MSSICLLAVSKNLIGWTWASTTLACMTAYTRVLDRLLFIMSTFKNFVMVECMCKQWKRVLRATARLQHYWREGQQEWRQFKLNTLAAHMVIYFLINLCYESDNCITRHAGCKWQQNVQSQWWCLLQCLAWPPIHSRDFHANSWFSGKVTSCVT